MKINNLQGNRKILEKSDIFSYFKKIHKKSKILISNFGFIVVPNNKQEKVRKYFIEKSFFDKEINNYIYLYGKIIIPKINIIGRIKILKKGFYLIEIENIRRHRPKFQKITDIKEENLGKILSYLHSLNFNNGVTYLHGNLHQSNFFKNKEGKLGIFDFVGMVYGRIEYDFMIIYINSNFNDLFINKILYNYKFKDDFKFDIFYKFTLERIISDIKFNRYYNYGGLEGLRKILIKIKIKLGNLT